MKNVRGAMNCATTNAFFGNDDQSFRTGIISLQKRYDTMHCIALMRISVSITLFVLFVLTIFLPYYLSTQIYFINHIFRTLWVLPALN